MDSDTECGEYPNEYDDPMYDDWPPQYSSPELCTDDETPESGATVHIQCDPEASMSADNSGGSDNIGPGVN